MSGVSPAIMREVEAAMPATGEAVTRAAILEAMGRGTVFTVKVALRQLIEEGRVERIGDHMNPTFRRCAR